VSDSGESLEWQRDHLKFVARRWPPDRQSGPTCLPVLLLHGLGDLGLIWQSVVSELHGYDCVAPDLRGHGGSAKPETGYDSATIIADLEALLDDLGWDSVHVVAHSWTARLVPRWASQSPQRLRSLTLIDPFFIRAFPAWARLSFPLLYRTLPFLKLMGPFPSRDAAEQCARSLKQFQAWSPLQQAVFTANLEQKPDGQWGSLLTRAARNGIFEDTLRVDGLTAPLATPTLLMLLEQGLNRANWQISPFYRYCQQLEIARLPGNHWPMLVEPHACGQRIAQFLQQVESV
jgi:pimeloyl-ACP methyl ester carboxylesterase